MPANKVTIKLTDDQQKQISAATGKNVTELHINIASTGQLTEKDLDQAAGGSFSFGVSQT